MSSFGEKLRYERLRKNISQASLADQVGVTREAITKYETGPSIPSAVTYLRILRVLPNAKITVY